MKEYKEWKMRQDIVIETMNRILEVTRTMANLDEAIRTMETIRDMEKVKIYPRMVDVELSPAKMREVLNSPWRPNE
jgi:hypothetical protein